MEQEILDRLKTQEALCTKIYASVEKTRNYLKWTFYLTLVFFVLPLLIFVFVAPILLGSLSSMYAGII